MPGQVEEPPSPVAPGLVEIVGNAVHVVGEGRLLETPVPDLVDEGVRHPRQVRLGEAQPAPHPLQRRLDVDESMAHVLHQVGPGAVGAVLPDVGVRLRVVLQLIVEEPQHLLALLGVERPEVLPMGRVVGRGRETAQRHHRIREGKEHVERLVPPPGPLVEVVAPVLTKAAVVLFRPPGVRLPVGVPLGDHVLFHDAEELVRPGLVGRVQGRSPARPAPRRPRWG